MRAGPAGYSRGMRWAELRTRQPRLAGVGEAMLTKGGVVLVVTLRRDGLPRLSPVEPFFWEGDLWFLMLLGSLKARDLLRDPRILVHSIVTDRDGSEGEYKVRGRAVAVDGRDVQERCAAAVAEQLPWEPEAGTFHLFRVDVEDVVVIRWDEATGDQYLTRWPAGVEQVRRGVAATALGPPEPTSDLLA
jgi:Pyridoxamine 5'-phosphate oxidase